MNTYKRHRFPPDIISYAVWLYYRLNLSHETSKISWPSVALPSAEKQLRSYGVAYRELVPETIHSTKQYENNRAEQSHEATRVRERGMRGPASRRFKSVRRAQRFLGAHAAVSNLFNLGRHLVRAQHYRDLRVSAFTEWSKAVA